MTWRYEQSTGRLWHLEGTGYSGKDEAKNRPDMDAVKGRGPIPCGAWRITERFDHPHKGPICLRLEPERGTDTHGRSGFLVHGDSISAPGTASEGCIILPNPVRRRIWASGDRILEVVK
jgi:hypothetical protein